MQSFCSSDHELRQDSAIHVSTSPTVLPTLTKVNIELPMTDQMLQDRELFQETMGNRWVIHLVIGSSLCSQIGNCSQKQEWKVLQLTSFKECASASSPKEV